MCLRMSLFGNPVSTAYQIRSRFFPHHASSKITTCARQPGIHATYRPSACRLETSRLGNRRARSNLALTFACPFPVGLSARRQRAQRRRTIGRAANRVNGHATTAVEAVSSRLSLLTRQQHFRMAGGFIPSGSPFRNVRHQWLSSGDPSAGDDNDAIAFPCAAPPRRRSHRRPARWPQRAV